MRDNNLLFSSELPYPSIKIEFSHHQYARFMLDNMGGMNSEMSTISMYLYNNLMVEENYRDIAVIYHKTSIVEMHHLNIFGKLAIALGEPPGLWSYQHNQRKYWSSSYNQYHHDLKRLVHQSLHGELAAIRKYKEQVNYVDDRCIADNLKRIIIDEEIHVSIFEKVICDYHL